MIRPHQYLLGLLALACLAAIVAVHFVQVGQLERIIRVQQDLIDGYAQEDDDRPNAPPVK